MFEYYTVIIFLNVFAMLVLQFCIGSSNTLTKERKMLFRFLFATITVAALGEWLGVFLDGGDPSTRWLHITAKAVELSVAPSIAFIFAWIIEKKWTKPIATYLGIHCIAECLSGVFGFIYYVDENNYYFHGKFYWIYIAAYAISIVYTICIVLRNVKKYQYNGVLFFLLTAALMCTGIIIQLCNSNLKVDYVTLGISSTIIYVFTLEMIQQTDELTELLNRRGFNNCIAHMDQECIIAFFDVDNFKEINDTYGHAFGDAVLKNVGAAIKKHYVHYGKCFRYGGDEFCVIMTRHLDSIDQVNLDFAHSIAQMQETEARMPSVSIGYAAYDPKNQSIQDAIENADKMMYKFKATRKAKAEGVLQ